MKAPNCAPLERLLMKDAWAGLLTFGSWSVYPFPVLTTSGLIPRLPDYSREGGFGFDSPDGYNRTKFPFHFPALRCLMEKPKPLTHKGLSCLVQEDFEVAA